MRSATLRSPEVVLLVLATACASSAPPPDAPSGAPAATAVSSASGTIAWPDLASPSPSAEDGAKDAALIVAIENYAFLPPIPGALRNGRDWFTYLTQSRKVPVERVRLLTNADATDFAISSAAEEAAKLAQPGGRVWFIFIGHGAPSRESDDGLLVASDAQQTVAGLERRSLPQLKVLEVLSKGPATPVAIVDACFSGRRQDGETLIAGLQPSVVKRFTIPSTAIVLTAAAQNEYAGPLPGDQRPAFSYLALGALRGWGDLNRDGVVTAGEAVDYSRMILATLLAGTRAQTPALAGAGNGTVLGAAGESGPDLAQLLLQVKAGATVEPQANAMVPRSACPSGTAQVGQECVPQVRCPPGATFVSGQGCVGRSNLSANAPSERKSPGGTSAAKAPARTGRTARTSKGCSEASPEVCQRGCWDVERAWELAEQTPDGLDQVHRAPGGDCAVLGAMYLRGSGTIAQDAPYAAKLFGLACDTFDYRACVALGEMYRDGHGVEQDDSRALRFLRLACKEQAYRGCNALAWMYENGRGLDANTAEARRLYGLACNGGISEACAKTQGDVFR